MKIIRVFILISLFFLAGCDNTAPELHSAQINTHDNNVQSNTFCCLSIQHHLQTDDLRHAYRDVWK